MGRAVDVLRGAEHRPHAVQDPRLGSGPGAGPADGPRSDGHLRRAGGRGAGGHGGRSAVHQLHQGRGDEEKGGVRRRDHLHHLRALRAVARLLDRQQHHRELPRPEGASFPEEGDRSVYLHRLGRRRAAAHRWGSAVLLLLQRSQKRILPPQTGPHQDLHSQRRV